MIEGDMSAYRRVRHGRDALHRRQLKGASQHFSRTSFRLAGTRREYHENKTGAGQYLSPGRRRCALACPRIAESPGPDVGLAKSGFKTGFQPWVSAIQECALKVAPDDGSAPGAMNSIPEKAEKIPIQCQKPIANRKSNISLPPLLGSDWRCVQILVA